VQRQATQLSTYMPSGLIPARRRISGVSNTTGVVTIFFPWK
jgi:hypothetical protein